MQSFLNILTENWVLFWERGFKVTIMLFVIAAIGSLVLGTLLAAMRVSPVPAMRAFGASYVNVIRNTPLTLVFAFMAFGADKLQVVLPGTFGRNAFFTGAYVALIIYTAAFVCEVVRSGVNTVSPGQSEAARAIGMTFAQVLGLIVLPQAFRAIVPPLTSVMIAMLKNTTIAAGFSVLELGAVRAYISERGGDQIHTMLWAVIFFLVLITPLVVLQRAMERRWRVSR